MQPQINTEDAEKTTDYAESRKLESAEKVAFFKNEQFCDD